MPVGSSQSGSFGSALWRGCVYGIFQLTAIGLMYQHVRGMKSEKEVAKSMIYMFVIDAAVMELAVFGLLAVAYQPELSGYSVPMLLLSRSFFADSSIHACLFRSLLLRLLSFDFSLCIFLAQAGQYFDMPERGTYSTPHTVQFLGFNAVHRFVGVICNSPTKPMNL